MSRSEMSFGLTGPSCVRSISRRRVLMGVGMVGGLALLDRSRAVALRPGRTIFVSPSGSDQNVGTEQSPFSTFNEIFRKIRDLGAGDVIVAKPGVYHEAVMVSAGGDASANLTIRSEVPHGAIIRSPRNSYSAISILRNFVTIDGFDVQSGGTGHGIEATFIDGDNRRNGPHHIIIRNTICHDNAGSGISLSYGDFYLVENNLCYGNCATNSYQGSGISVYAARAVEGAERLRIIIRGNTCHSNMALVLPGDVPHSDGNGIIIDDLRNTQLRYPSGTYPYTTLVENNLCYLNGGKGIHVFLSENVVVRNNTACYNNRDPKNPATWRGELSNVDSNHCVWVNNIGVAKRTTNPANSAILDASTSGSPNSDVVWMRNLTFDGRVGSPSVTQWPGNPTLVSQSPYRNIFGKDPQFVNAVAIDTDADFRLLKSSPAIDAGTAAYGISSLDRKGDPRNQGRRVDLGAFESGS